MTRRRRRRRRQRLPVTLDRPISFATAAVEVGWVDDARDDAGERARAAAGRRLRRLVLQREKEIGHEFAIRDRAGDARSVTLGALTRYLPELRPHRLDALAASLRPLLQGADGRIEEIVRVEVDRRLALTERARKG